MSPIEKILIGIIIAVIVMIIMYKLGSRFANALEVSDESTKESS